MRKTFRARFRPSRSSAVMCRFVKGKPEGKLSRNLSFQNSHDVCQKNSMNQTQPKQINV